MKLYATTTSERGKPSGKGGNTQLDIQLTVSNSQRREYAGLIQMREEKKNFFRITFNQGGNFRTIAEISLQENTPN